MKSVVHSFVTQCQVCLQAIPDRACYPGKLQALHVPSEAWKLISMDFVEGLPRSKNANCILIFVDKFTRYAHFIALSHHYTAATVAALFMDSMYKVHGLPAGIISNRDPIFTSTFWQ
jgi:transposase InsO family protein